MDKQNAPKRPDRDEVRSDEVSSPDDPLLTQYDKELADSFPASDPPAQP